MKPITLPTGKRSNNKPQRNGKERPTGGASPLCLECKAKKSEVIDTRQAGDRIRRRRRCLHCGNRFTTYEETVVIQEIDYQI